MSELRMSELRMSKLRMNELTISKLRKEKKEGNIKMKEKRSHPFLLLLVDNKGGVTFGGFNVCY